MKRAAIIIILGVLLTGCWCKHCRGQSVNDLVIDATEAKEFKDTLEDLWNYDAASVADLIFVIATNAEIPTGTETVAINEDQLNRWFNTSLLTSCLSRAYWRLGEVAVTRRMTFRDSVMDHAVEQAPARIESATEREKFLSRIEYLRMGN